MLAAKWAIYLQQLRHKYINIKATINMFSFPSRGKVVCSLLKKIQYLVVGAIEMHDNCIYISIYGFKLLSSKFTLNILAYVIINLSI